MMFASSAVSAAPVLAAGINSAYDLRQLIQGTLVEIPAGTLAAGIEGEPVQVPAFQIMSIPVTMEPWFAYLELFKDQSYARFAEGADGYLRALGMAETEKAAKNFNVPVQPGAPVARLLPVQRVVPTRAEFEARFDHLKAGLREIFLKPDHPLVCVSFFEALAMATALGFEIPTDDQWEWAARQGLPEGALYATDDGTLRDPNHERGANARFCPHSKGTTGSVREFNSTPGDLYGMAGNVWDWVLRKKGVIQGLRGGSWYGGSGDLELDFRGFDGPGLRFGSVGVRFALFPRTS